MLIFQIITSSYSEGRTSLRVRLRHMNECRIFHNIKSITFSLYTQNLNCLLDFRITRCRSLNVKSDYISLSGLKWKVMTVIKSLPTRWKRRHMAPKWRWRKRWWMWHHLKTMTFRNAGRHFFRSVGFISFKILLIS